MGEKKKIGELLLSWNLITQQDLESALNEQREKGGFLGQILINRGVISQQDVARALEELSSGVKEKPEVGRLFVEQNLISQEQLNIALDKQKTTGQNLDEILIELEFASAEQIGQLLGTFLNIPFIKLSNHEIKIEILNLIPEQIIRNNQIIPVTLEQNTLYIAISDPLDFIVLEQLKLISKYRISPMLATKKEIRAVIERYFNLQQMIKKMLSEIDVEKVNDGVSVSRLANTIIQAGVNSRASDIHIEPRQLDTRLRFRIDGILHDIIVIPKTVTTYLVSRIKILADMDIAEHRRPQDGHVSFKFNEKEYDLRIATTSTISGEKIVIRILDKTGMLLGLDELGFTIKERQIVRALINRPHGIILVTGPTGSGKTTTLYAILSQIDRLSKNIITIEDPVEYKIEGINQEQVNPAANITFSTGLRSMLRQDPDVIMVGEIRDAETASIAINAALTGHLVFSTLHTNDAASAVARLIDLGIEPFLVSSALIAVIAQRLVRVICPSCKEEYTADAQQLKELGLSEDAGKKPFFRGKGCQYCVQTAYYGRTGIFEVMRVTELIRELILQKQPAVKIKETAIKEGMAVLRTAAIEKVFAGITTFQEINRVIFTSEE